MKRSNSIRSHISRVSFHPDVEVRHIEQTEHNFDTGEGTSTREFLYSHHQFSEVTVNPTVKIANSQGEFNGQEGGIDTRYSISARHNVNISYTETIKKESSRPATSSNLFMEQSIYTKTVFMNEARTTFQKEMGGFTVNGLETEKKGEAEESSANQSNLTESINEEEAAVEPKDKAGVDIVANAINNGIKQRRSSLKEGFKRAETQKAPDVKPIELSPPLAMPSDLKNQSHSRSSIKLSTQLRLQSSFENEPSISKKTNPQIRPRNSVISSKTQILQPEDLTHTNSLPNADNK